MPIDPNFQANRVATTVENLKAWNNASSSPGINGTDIAVDYGLCIGDAACIEVCPVNVFDWQGADADRKALPSSKRDYIYSLGCKAVCPKFVIRVNKP